MIISNITTLVSWQVRDKWLTWLRDTHLPAMMATGCFTHYRIVQVLEIPDDEGPTYAVQLFTEHLSTVERFRRLYQPGFESEERLTWGDSAYSFRSIMEVIN